MNKTYQYIFKRDENGKLSSTGTYSNDAPLTKTSIKYLGQGCFSFGVAKLIKLDNNLPVGVRMEEIDYTGKNIVNRLLKKRLHK